MHQRSFILAVVGILFVLFFAGGPGYYSARSFRYSWNFGHIIFFCLSVGLVLSEYKSLQRRPLLQQLGLLLLASFFIGGSIELIQSGLSRSADLGDMWRNTIGVLLGFVLFSSARKEWPLVNYILFSAVVVVLIAIQVKPVVALLVDEVAAHNEFPLLSNFEHDRELSRFEGSANFSFFDGRSTKGNRSLKIITNSKRFSGVNFKHFPNDWSGYQWFKADIYSAADDVVKLTVRINDAQHGYHRRERYDDRFNYSFSLQSGWNQIEIDLSDVEAAPANRRMDMTDIELVGIFVISEPEPLIFYLDNLRLSH
jgi:hypothetical protein